MSPARAHSRSNIINQTIKTNITDGKIWAFS